MRRRLWQDRPDYPARRELNVSAVVGLIVTAIGVTGAAAVAVKIAITVAITAALAAASYLLAPKPKKPSLGNAFAQQSQEQTIEIRQPSVPWKYVIGHARVGGFWIYADVVNSNADLYMVFGLCKGPVEAIPCVLLDDYPVYPDDLDADGWVTTGKYADKIRIIKHLGATDQAADGVLVAASERWTSDHRLQGIAYLVVQYVWNRDTFSSGRPEVTAIVQGSQFVDPRDGGDPVWTQNAIAAQHGYLRLATNAGGYGCAAEEVDDPAAVTGANICDEIVQTVDLPATAQSVDHANDAINLDDDNCPFQTGDRLKLTTDGTLPTGLSGDPTRYYAIVTQIRKRAEKDDGTDISRWPRIQLASSYDNAVAGTAVSFSDAGSGTLTVTKDGEPRYACDGVIDTSRNPGDILKDMVTACAGRAVWKGGAFHLLAGAWVAPTVTFAEGDFRGGIRVTSKHSRRERFNALKGQYTGPEHLYQPQSYPALESAAFKAEDNGEAIFADYNLPFTARPTGAQRIVNIELFRHRRQVRVTVPLKLRGLRVAAGMTTGISYTTRSWTAKSFEVTDFTFEVVENEGGPVLGTRVSLAELDSAVFDWDHTVDEQPVNRPAGNRLPSATIVGEPVGLTLTETLYEARDGGGVKARATLAWQAADDAFVDSYELKFTDPASSNEVILPIEGLQFEIADVTPGQLAWGVRSVNALGIRSGWVERTDEIFGLSADPVALTGVTVVAVGGLAVIRWNQTPDLDVKQGGKIVFRHASATSGATWAGSVSIGDAVTGDQTVALLPLKQGTYLLRPFDSTGNKGPVTTVVVDKQTAVLAFANTDTLSAHTAWSGAHTNTTNDGGALTLSGAALIDDWGLVDDVANWDSEGGISAEGTYDFASGFDFTSVVRRRLTATITAQVQNTLDLIDSRTSNIDDWEDFDGADSGEADAQCWFRVTDDDPAGSPVWSAWDRLDTAEIEARGVDFQARLFSNDPAYNIAVSAMTVDADEVT